MIDKIAITGCGSISSLGSTRKEIEENYRLEKHFLTNDAGIVVGKMSDKTKGLIDSLKTEKKQYNKLDDVTLYAMLSARIALKEAGWKDDNFGVNIGSSRGATELFEKYILDFHNRKKAHPLTSPSTTLGNISSWVAQDLGSKGITLSHSITCSSASHAVLNGVAWIQSGMSSRFLVGGSEAPLTPFTISQMQSLKIYTNERTNFPCRSLDLNKNNNTMCLGEGAATFCLEKNPKKTPLAFITGIGYANEHITHPTSISDEGVALQESMKMALSNIDPNDIDVVIAHAPGTIKGDQSEINAINEVFKQHNTPIVTSNKWKIGHTLGASSALSIEMGLIMLAKQDIVKPPYQIFDNEPKTPFKNILINAIGFGGNAVSIVISK